MITLNQSKIYGRWNTKINDGSTFTFSTAADVASMRSMAHAFIILNVTTRSFLAAAVKVHRVAESCGHFQTPILFPIGPALFTHSALHVR